MKLRTTVYDGHVIETPRDKYLSEQSWAAGHRRKVRRYLQVNRLCELDTTYGFDLTGTD